MSPARWIGLLMFFGGLALEVYGVLKEITSLMWLGGAIFMGSIFWMGWVRKKEHQIHVVTATVASHELGLETVSLDEFDVGKLPFQLTGGARRPHVNLVRRGTFKDVEVTVFDFSWQEETGKDRYGQMQYTTVSATCAVAPLDFEVPRVIFCDPAFTPAHCKIRKGPTPDVLRAYWEFRGSADYADHMTDDEGLMERLQEMKAHWYFEVAGRKIVCLKSGKGLAKDQQQIVERLEGLVGVRERLAPPA